MRLKTRVPFQIPFEAQLWGVLALLQFPRLHLLGSFVGLAHPEARGLAAQAQLLCKWDCELIQGIAGGSVFWGANFPPIWPWLVRGAMKALPFLPGTSVQILLSNLLTLAALRVLYALGLRLWPSRERWNPQALLLCGAASFFPYSIYFSLGYSEPLFLLEVAAMGLAVLERRWLWAGAAAATLPLTRVPGLWIAPLLAGFLLLWPLFGPERNATERNKNAPGDEPARLGGATIALCGWAAVFAWCWFRFGNPFQLIEGQKAFGKTFRILPGILNHVPRWDNSRILLWLSLIAAWALWKRREPHWKLLALMTAAHAEAPNFFGGFLCFPRYMSTSLGLLVFLTELGARSRWILLLLLGAALALLPVEAYRWVLVPVFTF